LFKPKGQYQSAWQIFLSDFNFLFDKKRLYFFGYKIIAQRQFVTPPVPDQMDKPGRITFLVQAIIT
jgi:hypothetical protein